MDTNTPNSSEPKKGLSGLAIAGIGCGGLLILLGIGVMLLLAKGCAMVKEAAGDFQKNPAKAAAVLMVKANPDLDLVKTDDTTGEITVRDKKSGQTTSMSFDDLSKGKLTFKNDKGEEVSIDASGANNKAGIVIKGPKGQTVIGGTNEATAPPSWVPMYPGATSDSIGGMREEKDDHIKGNFIGQTTDPMAKVKEFYETKLKEAGYTTETNTININGVDSASISGKKDDGKTSVDVMLNGAKEKTAIILGYEGKK